MHDAAVLPMSMLLRCLGCGPSPLHYVLVVHVYDAAELTMSMLLCCLGYGPSPLNYVLHHGVR